MILAIDPGNIESAWVLYDDEKRRVGTFRKEANSQVLKLLRTWGPTWGGTTLVIERIACYGMPVGDEVFETCYWTGRFTQAWYEHSPASSVRRLFRQDVKLHLCKSPRANDATIRQALIDKFGGKDKAIGKKKTPGTLYGIAGDVWSALAVAVTFAETHAATAAQEA